MSKESEQLDAAATERIVKQVNNLNETIAIITNLHGMISQSSYIGSAAKFVAQGLGWLENMRDDLTVKRDGFQALLPKPPAPPTPEKKPEGTSEPGTPPVVPATPEPATPPAPKEPA